jgi:hypothetical protein
VLHEQYGGFLSHNRFEHEVHEREFLISADPAGRLVEQKHSRAASHRESDIEKLPSTLRQLGRSAIGIVLQPELGKDRFDSRNTAARA